MQRLKVTFILNTTRDPDTFAKALTEALEFREVLEAGDIVVVSNEIAYMVSHDEESPPVEVFE